MNKHTLLKLVAVNAFYHVGITPALWILLSHTDLKLNYGSGALASCPANFLLHPFRRSTDNVVDHLWRWDLRYAAR